MQTFVSASHKNVGALDSPLAWFSAKADTATAVPALSRTKPATNNKTERDRKRRCRFSNAQQRSPNTRR